VALEESSYQEYQALTQQAGWCQLPLWTQLQFRGRDRAAFLQGMCTNEIRGRSPGEGCEAFFTNVQGKILGYVHLFVGDDAIDATGSPAQAETLIAHLDRYIIREDVSIEDLSSARRLLLLCGPAAPTHLEKLGGPTFPLQPGRHATWTWGGVGVQVRCLETQPPVFQVSCAGEDESRIAELLQQVGVQRCGAEALQALRLELGWPYYGCDVTEQNFPQEVDRNARAISFTKGCYLGQETVARIDALGHVNWYLRGLRLPEDESWDHLPQLVVEGKTVARLTSRGDSPQLGSGLALAYVRRAQEQAGTRLAGPQGEAEVVVLPLPF
jgi:tRNA-modifying protein YgfZ